MTALASGTYLMLAAPMPGGCTERMGLVFPSTTPVSVLPNVYMTPSNVVTSNVNVFMADAPTGKIKLSMGTYQLAWKPVTYTTSILVFSPVTVSLGWKLVWDNTGSLLAEQYDFRVNGCCFSGFVPAGLCYNTTLSNTKVLANSPLSLEPAFNTIIPTISPDRTFICLKTTPYTTAREVLFSSYEMLSLAAETILADTDVAWDRGSFVTSDWYFYTAGAYPPTLTCDIPDCCALVSCGCPSTCSPGCDVPAPAPLCGARGRRVSYR